MSDVDHYLIYRAQKFITAANVHEVNTWIFCYQMFEPDSPRRKRYEQLLREFVGTKNLTLGTRVQAELARDRRINLRALSTVIDEQIRQFL